MSIFGGSKSNSATDQVTDASPFNQVLDDSLASGSAAGLNATDIEIEDGSTLAIISSTSDLGAVSLGLEFAEGAAAQFAALAGEAVDESLSFAERTQQQSFALADDALGYSSGALREAYDFAGDAQADAYSFAQDALTASTQALNNAAGIVRENIAGVTATIGRVTESAGESNAERFEGLAKLALIGFGVLGGLWILNR